MTKTVLYRIYTIINIILLFLFVISFFSAISSIINYIVLLCVFLACAICNVIYCSKRKSGKENIITQRKEEFFRDYVNRKQLRKYEMRAWWIGCDDIPYNNLLNVFSFIALIISFSLPIVFSILSLPMCDFNFKLIDGLYKIDIYKYLISVAQRIFPLFLCVVINKSTLNVLWYICGENKSGTNC